MHSDNDNNAYNEDAFVEEFQKAYYYTLRLLNRRYYSSQEITDRLTRKGVPEPIIGELLKYLKEEKLINDLRFSEAWVNDRLNFKPRGKSLIRSELKSRGITGDIIDGVIADLYPEEEITVARQAIKNKIEYYLSLERTVGIRRAFNYLARRGFSYGTARQVISEIFGG